MSIFHHKPAAVIRDVSTTSEQFEEWDVASSIAAIREVDAVEVEKLFDRHGDHYDSPHVENALLTIYQDICGNSGFETFRQHCLPALIALSHNNWRKVLMYGMDLIDKCAGESTERTVDSYLKKKAELLQSALSAPVASSREMADYIENILVENSRIRSEAGSSYCIVGIIVFGSYAAGRQHQFSDLDIITIYKGKLDELDEGMLVRRLSQALQSDGKMVPKFSFYSAYDYKDKIIKDDPDGLFGGEKPYILIVPEKKHLDVLQANGLGPAR